MVKTRLRIENWVRYPSRPKIYDTFDAKILDFLFRKKVGGQSKIPPLPQITHFLPITDTTCDIFTAETKPKTSFASALNGLRWPFFDPKNDERPGARGTSNRALKTS